MLVLPVTYAGASEPGDETMRLYEGLVIGNNLELAALNEQLNTLRESYTKIFHLSESTISVSGGYSYAGGGEHDLSGTASIHIPVIPQLSFDLQATASGVASIQVSISPLATLSTNVGIEEQMAILELSIAHKREQLRWESRSTLLIYAAERNLLRLRDQISESERLRYEEAERQFEAGYLSTDEMRTAADSYAVAATNRIAIMQQSSNAENNLYMLAGVTDLPQSIFDFASSSQQIESIVSEAERTYEDHSGNAIFTTPGHCTMLIQKRYQEREIAGRWPVEPGVTLSLSGTLSGLLETPLGTAGANLSLSLGGASFHFDEIRELRRELRELETALQLESISIAIDELNLEGALESARLLSAIGLRNFESMIDAAAQAKRDIEADEISMNEYEDILYNRDLAESGYAESLIALYGILGALIQAYELGTIEESSK